MLARMLSAALCAGAMLVAAAEARADDPPPPNVYVPKLEKDELPQGPSYAYDLGATFAFDHNKNVVGQPDGALVTFGYKLALSLGYNDGPNEWRGSLDNAETLSKTPSIAELVKTRDVLALDGTYLRHVLPWFGPFVHVSAETALFRGVDVRAAPTTYAIARLDGTTQTVESDRLRLTEPLRPASFKQSVGPFADPVRSDEVSVEIRAGAGARETIASGQIAIDDDSTTPQVEAKELQSFAQVGVEALAKVWGAFATRGLTYSLTAEAMTPFVHTDLPANDTRGALALTNLSLDGKLSLKLVSVLSLDYELLVLREPQLIDVVQVRNNLLISLSLASASAKAK